MYFVASDVCSRVGYLPARLMRRLKTKRTSEEVLFVLVRVTGLEPVRQRHTPLKRACLPIPAHSHMLHSKDCRGNRNDYIMTYGVCQLFFRKFIR